MTRAEAFGTRVQSGLVALARPEVILALAAGSSIVVGLAELPLVWDGSSFMFTALNEQTPLLIFHRTVESILTAPVVAASHVTDDLAILRKVFSLTYATVPAIALGLSWLVVRRARPDLFVWPVLGIALALLPGRALTIAESLIAAQLSWPIFLAAIVPVERRIALLCLAVGAVVAVSHPAALIFLSVIGVVGYVERARSGSRTRAFRWIGALSGLAALNVMLLTSRLDAYEVDVAQPVVLAYQFVKIAISPQIVGLQLTALTALLVLRAGRARSDSRPLYARAAVTAAIAVLPFLIWAAIPAMWWDIIEYRAWAVPVTVPLFVVAWSDARRPDGSMRVHVSERMRIATVAASIMFVVLVAQGLGWVDLVGRLERAVAAGHGCVAGESIDGFSTTALGSWAVVPLSILLQGRSAHAFVAPARLCGAAAWPREAPVPTLPALTPRWFRFE